MTCNVFGGTLSLTQSINLSDVCDVCQVQLEELEKHQISTWRGLLTLTQYTNDSF